MFADRATMWFSLHHGSWDMIPGVRNHSPGWTSSPFLTTAQLQGSLSEPPGWEFIQVVPECRDGSVHWIHRGDTQLLRGLRAGHFYLHTPQRKVFLGYIIRICRPQLLQPRPLLLSIIHKILKTEWVASFYTAFQLKKSLLQMSQWLPLQQTPRKTNF